MGKCCSKAVDKTANATQPLTVTKAASNASSIMTSTSSSVFQPARARPPPEQPKKTAGCSRFLQMFSPAATRNNDGEGEDLDLEEDYTRRIKYVKTVPLFRHVPASEYPILAEHFRVCRAPKDTVLLDRGQKLVEFTVIVSGEVEARIFVGDQEEVKTLRPGDYFAERLIEQGRDPNSNVRITAKKNMTLLCITKAEFEKTELRKYIRIPKRQAVTGPQLLNRCKSKKCVSSPKLGDEKSFLGRALKENKNLRSMVDLTDSLVDQLIEAAERREVKKGEAVVKQGEHGGNFIIVYQGQFELTIDGEAAEARDQSTKSVINQTAS